MKKYLRILILMGVAVVILPALFFAGHFSRTHSRLQAYKAELRRRGEKLSFAELAMDYPTNIQNADSLKEFMDAVTGLKNFRLHPSTLPIRQYVGPGRARAVWMEDHPAWGDSKAAVGQSIWEEFAQEINELKPTLAAIRDSLKSPATATGAPKASWGGRPIQDFVAIRSAAQWLAGAALSEVRQGNLEDGLANLEALAALGRMNRDDYRLVAQMIRVAVTGLGLATTWEILQAPGWTETQLERLQKAWERLDLVDGLERSFLAERAQGTELWATLRAPGGARRLTTLISGSTSPNSPQAAFEQFTSEHVWLPLYKLTSIEDDELFYLQVMQEGIDALRLAKARHPWKQARQGIDRTLIQINLKVTSWQKFRYPLSMFATPNLSKAADNAIRAETERRLTITAIALRRFQLRRWALPKDLDELVPNFLAEAPYDPMSGAALSYHLKSNEDFCLYSVGEDGCNDGGDPTGATNRLGLWEGRDAVWPAAVNAHSNVEAH